MVHNNRSHTSINHTYPITPNLNPSHTQLPTFNRGFVQHKPGRGVLMSA